MLGHCLLSFPLTLLPVGSMLSLLMIELWFLLPQDFAYGRDRCQWDFRELTVISQCG